MFKKIMIFNALVTYMKAMAALFIYIFTNKKEKIWLFGALGGKVYSDNTKVFYEYVLNNHPEITAYWVAEKNSIVMHQALGNVVQKGSIDNYLLYYKSQAVIFSGMINADIAPFLFVFPFARKFYSRPFQVRLNHGTISFKKMNVLKGAMQKIREKTFLSIDLNIAATELEYKVMSSYMRNGSIVLAGSARNDTVFEENTHQKSIFIAPTYRTWLHNGRSFTKSCFYKKYIALLSDDLLLETLRQHNIKLNFYLHYNMFSYRKHFKFLSNDVVCIAGEELDVSKNILGSALMITDYSSICSERYFLKKDVAFFQFDQDKYELEMGAYFDLKKDIYGDVYTNVTDIRERIMDSIKNDFTISDKQIEGEKYFVNFTDRNNCQRIYNEISIRMNTIIAP